MFPGQNNPSNPNDFQVTPKQEVQTKNRPIVRVYFIGTKTLRDGKTPPIVNIAGRVLQMPPIGEYLDVTDVTAKELMHRLVWSEKGVPIPGITTSKEIADAVKAAFERGDKDLDVRQMVANHSVTSIPESVLIAELVRRGHDVSQLALATAKDDKAEPLSYPASPADEVPVEVTPPAPPAPSPQPAPAPAVDDSDPLEGMTPTQLRALRKQKEEAEKKS